jgi:zinc D-Ala-D-Ala dipeptidase
MSKSIKILVGLLIVVSLVLLNIIAYRLLLDQANSEIELLKNDNVKLQMTVDENKSRIASLEVQIESLEETSIHFHNNNIFEISGLVEVRDLDPTIVVDLIYATDQNFTKQVLYNLEVCLLRRGTAEKLADVNTEVASKGYRIKVWDAFRPNSAQEIMWGEESNRIYVADPKVGSNHNRGASVDVTLVDQYGNELEMPTGFDVFDETASRSYTGMTEEARNNMDYLTEVMVKHGFRPIQSEWWHFNDADFKQYDFLAITLEEWVTSYLAYVHSLNR